MDIVIEHGEKCFNMNCRDGRRDFDDYVSSLPSIEEQYEVSGLALAAIDQAMRSLGFYCGLPLRDLSSASHELYGFAVPRTVSEIPEAEPSQNEKPRIINWWKIKKKDGKRGTVFIYEDKNGKRFHRIEYRALDWQYRFQSVVNSMLERKRTNPFQAELKAQAKLRTLISEEQYACYIMSGAFVERGKSDVHYLVRRGLPTIAFRIQEKDEVSLLTALCIKPMGGHRYSFAGVMVPTDEVIATVLLIQADEPELWKRANHLSIDDPVSGL